MRIPLQCGACSKVAGQQAPIAWAVPCDDGVYELKCPNGHVYRIALQEQKFEILFDIGLYAILDGYYREAFSAFAAALERFYEFFVTVMAVKYGVEEGAFLSAWKTVSNQTERQLGAFIFTYLLDRKMGPRLLNKKSIERRNGVIHKGKFPSRDDAIEFGREVLDLIGSELRHVTTTEQEHVITVIARHVRKMHTVGERPNSGMGFPTSISAARGAIPSEPAEPAMSFDEAMQNAMRWRDKWLSAR
jgi:hypothetical protein